MFAASVLRRVASPNCYHVRTLIVLKRSHPLRQPQVGEAHKNLQTKRMRTYELVPLTEEEKPKTIKVVLKELVEGYGAVGDVIEVPRNFGRFELIVPGRASYASPEALKWAETLQERGIEVVRFTSKTSPGTIRYLRSRVYALIMSEKNPWTLEVWHVRSHLRSQGLVVPEEAIVLPDKPINHNDGVFGKDIIITIKINGKDEARCRLRFRPAEELLSPATQLQEVEQPWYIDTPTALFESQAAEINQMHDEVMAIFQKRIEAIRSEGLRSIADLNVRAIF
ncbi:39S ribosomal protein L9, mitochondrial [Galendromus occidentalis]|uniref:Large ribosomal subunit protein bL9m n=1 Tax=Galendromus occidentalis TaxID=34638 RepID=A0AAJ6W027_9ACAR|nr:39S ribosomal protein L9, mitochondrial [Galendromus occidentalis]